MPRCRHVQRKPECLPEQLLCRSVGVLAGTGERHASLVIGRPVRAAFERRTRPARPWPASTRASATCAGSPLCEAQASASSRSPKPKRVRRAALDQRQRLDRLDGGAREDRASRHRRARSTTLPSPSQTMHAPRCPLSTMSPRSTSTSTGSVMIPLHFSSRTIRPTISTNAARRSGRVVPAPLTKLASATAGRRSRRRLPPARHSVLAGRGASQVCRSSAECSFDTSGVSIGPGATQFTRTLRLPNSRASTSEAA